MCIFSTMGVQVDINHLVVHIHREHGMSALPPPPCLRAGGGRGGGPQPVGGPAAGLHLGARRDLRLRLRRLLLPRLALHPCGACARVCVYSGGRLK